MGVRGLTLLSILTGLSALLLLSCGRSVEPPATPEDVTAPGPPYFTDMTKDSGLQFIHQNGEEADHYTILESLGGGVALLDYDGDGLLDIFVTGGGTFGPNQEILGRPNALFRNEGNWRFRDVTEEAGLASPVFYSHGAAAADFDNDGRPDLLVTGHGRMVLYRNVDGRFEDVTAQAGLDDPGPQHWSTSAGWADLNGNGLLDLYVAHYVDWSFANHPHCRPSLPDFDRDVCPPEKFNGLPHALYFNQGNGTFQLQKDAGIKPGKGLGVLLADFDDDGRVDMYVANDGEENYLYLNRGQGRFEEVGVRASAAYDSDGKIGGSMGLDAADYDGSGRLSIFVVNYENQIHCLYRNLGQGNFLCVSHAAGVTAIGTRFVGFGTGFLDFDRNGALDLFISNGHVLRHPSSGYRHQRPVLFRNQRQPGDPPGKARFVDVSKSAGPYFEGTYLGRGAALGDLDNDGAIDLVVSHIGTPVALLRNTARPQRGWLGVQLQGKAPRDAIGARLTLTQAGASQVHALKGGGSYLSTNDRRVVFSLAEEEDFRLSVRWPSGREQSWDGADLGRNRYVTLIEGEKTSR